MRLPGLKTLRLGARWARSRLVRRSLILGYHRVAEEAADPYGLCVAPSRFDEQLEALRRLARPISLVELARAVQDGNVPGGAVALTFDDGYADNLYEAKPVLERHGVPATVFAVTGFLGQEFWWDALERILLGGQPLPDRLEVYLGAEGFRWVGRAEPGTSARRRLFWTLYERLRRMPDDDRRQALRVLFRWAGMSPSPPEVRRALRRDEVQALVAGGLVDVGAHSVTHPDLGALTPSGRRSEITESKRALEELLGREVPTFSYPHGGCPPGVRAAVRQAGFACGCASRTDVVRGRSDLYRMPRFWVPDWDGERFARWLGRWLGR